MKINIKNYFSPSRHKYLIFEVDEKTQTSTTSIMEFYSDTQAAYWCWLHNTNGYHNYYRKCKN